MSYSMETLHDTEFEIEIMKRAVKSCAEQYFGIISKTELDNRLGKNGNFNSYLLDFEFNHFSIYKANTSARITLTEVCCLKCEVRIVLL